MQKLGDRMKEYEGEFEQRIPPYNSFIVRLDGKNFSKFTKGFRKPFDEIFVKAMVKTMNDMVNKWNATTGYCHSDEITLIFPNACTKEEFESGGIDRIHSYGGRVMKNLTVMAGYCSVRFVFNLLNLLHDEIDADGSHPFYKESTVNKITNCDYCFDARVLSFPPDKLNELVNHQIWRSVYDCERNAISTFGQYHFGHKRMHKKHSDETKAMLKDEVNVNWETDVPVYLKHGVYAKRELYTITAQDREGNDVEAIRQSIVNKCFKIHFSPEFLDLMVRKNWPENVSDHVGTDVTDYLV